jgi:phage shock protein PspC (stress-responsive transcriptional regulator)
MKKRFNRSETNRKIFGVCGGLAEYTNTEATLWRLLFVLMFFSTIPIIIIYLITTLVTEKV